MFWNKKPVIEFTTIKATTPTPKILKSGKLLPNNYRTMPEYNTLGSDNGTVRACIPFRESMLEGYTIPLWVDLRVFVTEKFQVFDAEGNRLDGPTVIELPNRKTSFEVGDNYCGYIIDQLKPAGPHVVVSTPEQSHQMYDEVHGHNAAQIPNLRLLNDASRDVYKLSTPWKIKTPKGWSCRFKKPSNNFDNDLCILEGLVDTDSYNDPINFPFYWIGKDKGVYDIEAGTPFVQVIPFERAALPKAVYKEETYTDFKTSFVRNKFYDWYKTTHWHKRKSK